MKKLLLLFIIAACATAAHAIDNDNVEIVYNGTTATVTVADNIADVVTVSSGTSSHVVITSATESVEISYALKGWTARISQCQTVQVDFALVAAVKGERAVVGRALKSVGNLHGLCSRCDDDV